MRRSLEGYAKRMAHCYTALVLALLMAPRTWAQDNINYSRMQEVLPAVDDVHGAFVGSQISVGPNYILAAADYSLVARDPPVAKRGAVHVFVRESNRWKHVQRIASPHEEITSFGLSVASHGDLAAVGAIESGDKPWKKQLVACVYRKTGDTWSSEAVLQTPGSGEYGYCVSVSGQRVAVGDVSAEPPRVLVYALENKAWRLEQVITKPALPRSSSFGMYLDLDGDTLAISARGEAVVEDRAGAVYVYQRRNSEWVEKARLTAPDPRKDDWFGQSVDVEGDRVVVGRPQFESHEATGSVHVFRWHDENWILEATINPASLKPRDWFGADVAIRDDCIVVGSYGHDPPNARQFRACGSAWVFRSTQGRWEFVECFSVDVDDDDISFGLRVGISQEWIVATTQDNFVSNSVANPELHLRPSRIFAHPRSKLKIDN